jgi:hypothetical protein
MERSFRSRLLSIDEVSHAFLKLLVALGGYCTVQQRKSLLRPRPDTQARARMRTLEAAGVPAARDEIPGRVSGHQGNNSVARTGFEQLAG